MFVNKIFKNKLLFLLALISFFLVTTTSSKASSPLGTRLSGKILLQVEDSGKAWYVSADNDNQRIYLGSPQEAHCLMKTLGLGISNNDLNRYLNTNNNKFPARLSGKILLAVEQNGEAYYINPDNLKGYYLGRPIDALKIMRELSLGITNTNLNTIPVLDNTEMLSKCNIITKTEEQQENTETNISLVTQEVAPMTNFSHIVSISATLTNPNNISIKERGILYDFTIFPNTNLTPTLDKHNQKLISETSSQNNTYVINISNLIPGSYPFIRSYAITGDNQIIYGNTVTIIGKNNIYLPQLPIPSSISSPSLIKYSVNYTSGLNGSIFGPASQEILAGNNSLSVEAIPDTGYEFVNWSDGSKENPRSDININEDISVEANFFVSCSSSLSCGDKCAYSGVIYNTILMGSQCWFNENLNVGQMLCADNVGSDTCSVDQTDNSIIEKYCYNNMEANCDLYGGLYQWREAMKHNTTINQGICPDGWHVPTRAEWNSLFLYIGTPYGTKLKASPLDNPAWDGNNNYGFSVVPSGMRIRSNHATIAGRFIDLGIWTELWTSTQHLSNTAFRIYFEIGISGSSSAFTSYDTQGNPIRCIKNSP